MKNIIEHIKKRIHDLEVEMNDHSEDIGEHTIYFAKMQGASVELLKLMQWIHGQEIDSEARRFAKWYEENYGAEISDRVLQEYDALRMHESVSRSEQLVCPECKSTDRKKAISGSLPSDDMILAESIQSARKADTDAGLLPSNNDIRMFCLGAKWIRDLAQGNDR